MPRIILTKHQRHFTLIIILIWSLFNQNLVSNWRHKRFTGAAVIDPDRCLHIQPFAMDQSRFVSYVAAKEEFYVIKRWQQTFEKVPMHFV